jgi:hypothetical protein
VIRSKQRDYQEAYRAAPSRRVAVVLALVGGFNQQMRRELKERN